jgi:hypothetical protein
MDVKSVGYTNINTAHSKAEAEKTAESKSKTSINTESAASQTSSAVDSYSNSPVVEQYNNYNSNGVVQTVATTATTQNTNTPDINVSEYRNWRDPRIQERMDILDKVFGRRAAESLRTTHPHDHAWRRYFDPTARHFVGGDMCHAERNRAFFDETARIIHLQLGTGIVSFDAWLDNPIFEGRGLGRSDPQVPRLDACDLNADRFDATQILLMRNAVNRQLNDLFQRNGIVIPENLRLRFSIDSESFILRVTGTDDEGLIRQIEEVLNRNGNAPRLWGHIFTSLRFGHEIVYGHAPHPGQLSEAPVRMNWLQQMLENYTGYSLRNDLTLTDGRLLTENSEDIMHIVNRKTGGHVAAFLIQELAWAISVGGPDAVSDLDLVIDFENGFLFDVGQSNGFGPGQTSWIDRLGGTMHKDGLFPTLP